MKGKSMNKTITNWQLVLWLAIVILSIYGWVSNIVEVFGADFSIVTGKLVLRVVGILIAPVGVVMGYL
jgi:hypothetical protein